MLELKYRYYSLIRRKERKMIDYTIEELLPIVAKLAESYTSYESSSVSYETAQMLLGAVVYCVEEYMGEGRGITTYNKLDIEAAYQRGCDLVVEKVYKAKEIYESLILDFEDYGCCNYRDTIQKGMPKFFLWYDPKYQPQNHILMLDYPVIAISEKLCGVDLIYQYLQNVEKEKRLLDCFGLLEIKQLLERMVSGYEELYMDNICEAVLFDAVKCFIADRSVVCLDWDEKDKKVVTDFIKGDEIWAAGRKIESIIKMIIKKLMDQEEDLEIEKYFARVGQDFAVRLLRTV